MADVDQIQVEVGRLRDAVAELSNGKWDWSKDGVAIATILSSIGGLVAGGVALLMQLGVLGS